MANDTEITPAMGSIGQWVVTTDHAYYGSVEYFATQAEAEQALCQILADDSVGNRRGDHYEEPGPRVILAHIVMSEPLAFVPLIQAASESIE